MATDDEVIKWIQGSAGLSGRHSDLSNRKKNAAILLPHDPLSAALPYLYGWYDTAKKKWTIASTCALFGRAVYVQCGVSDPVLDMPYLPRNGMAVSDVKNIALRHRAWTEKSEELAEIPKPLDLILVAYPEHVICVTGYSDATGEILSVDGGQVDGSWILPRSRIMLSREDGTFMVDPVTPYKMHDGVPLVGTNGFPVPNGRKVIGKAVASRF